MFPNSMPSDVQKIVASIVKNWNCTDIYVGCSGKFTIERLVYSLKKFNLHSNDVTLYSYCMGKYFAGENPEFDLTDEGQRKISWVEEYLKNPVDRLATIMLMSNIVWYMDRNNAYYTRMYNEYVKQFATLHAKTVANIEKNETSLASYFSGDVMQFVQDTPSDVGFVTYPPFEKAGKAYIKEFAQLESLFHFDTPVYTIFDASNLLEYFNLVASKKYWLIGTDMELPKPFDEYLKAISKPTTRSTAVYVYSNEGKTYFIGPRQNVDALAFPRLMPGEEVGDKMEIRPLSLNAFRMLRSEYLNTAITPSASASLCVGVFVDGKLCGAYAFGKSLIYTSWVNKYVETPEIYMMSDFPVEPVDYDRLAKLVLYAALSKESQLLAEQLNKTRVRSLVTTIFSQNPVSMKYRGLFKVLNRKEDNAYHAQQYQINYGAKMGEWTLDEGLQMWKKKHSQRTGKKELA